MRMFARENRKVEERGSKGETRSATMVLSLYMVCPVLKKGHGSGNRAKTRVSRDL